jgi:hypothetical protein
VSRRTIRNDERVVAELHRLLGVPSVDERPIPDLNIDKDAMLARIMAVVDAEEERARHQGTPSAVPRHVWTRLGSRWFHGLQWATATVVLLAVLAVVITVNIARAPAAVAGTPQPLHYSLIQPAEIAKAGNAQEGLVTLALAAATSQPPDVSAGASVQYVASTAWLLEHSIDDAATSAAIQPTETRRWLASDGSARISQYRTAPLGTDGSLDPNLPSSSVGSEASDDLPAGTFDATITQVLPRDPASLRVALLDLASGLDCTSGPESATVCLVNEIRTLYSQYVIQSDLAAALWTVLSDEPGMKYLGTTTDRLGRPAHGIALDESTSDMTRVLVLLISPSDGQLIGTETVTLKDPALGITEAAVTGFVTYTAHVWVSAIGDLPDR